MNKIKIPELLGIVIGCLIQAFALNTITIPAHLLSGGVTGLSIIVYHLNGWSIGGQYFIYNIPLLILGHKYIGKKFSLYTILGVCLLSLFLKLIPAEAYWTEDKLLSGIFGGVLTGVGSAIVLRMGGSTGGLDIVARIIAKYRNVSLGNFSLLVNGVIVTISAYLFTVQMAMYTLISIFASSKAYQVVLSHVDRISVMIITDKGEEISEMITNKIHRGVTVWDASGAFTHKEKQVVYCVIVNVQFPELKGQVLAVDDKAFISVIPTENVVGNFAKIW